MSPEILIYLQNIQEYLKKNIEAREYFLTGVNPEDFYGEVTKKATENFEKNGDPMLTIDDFENIRTKLMSVVPTLSEKHFLNVESFGKICLN